MTIVENDPRLRKDCFAYYFEQHPNALKPKPKKRSTATSTKNASAATSSRRGGGGGGGGGGASSNGGAACSSSSTRGWLAVAQKEEEELEEERESDDNADNEVQDNAAPPSSTSNRRGKGKQKAAAAAKKQKKTVSFTSKATPTAPAAAGGGAARGRGKGPPAPAAGGRGGARTKEAKEEDGVDDDETEFVAPPHIFGVAGRGKVCTVCLGPGGGKKGGGEALLECRGSNRNCKTLVHKNCYPVAVKTIDGRSGMFVCNACEREKSAGGVRPEERGCVICRQTQGVESYAMVPTKEGDLVHFLCFKKAVPDAESHWKFDNAGKYVPPPGVPEALARAKAKRRCSECKRTGGVVKTCERQDCRTRYVRT
ncbi:unnamed protein product [Ectocarpus sp. 4 AP-2014]